MGYVLAAEHVQLGTRVALKLLHPHVTMAAGARARFLREARAAARISSPHVVRVFDIDELEDGGLFLVMERLEGRDPRASSAREERSRWARPRGTCSRRCTRSQKRIAEGWCTAMKPANMFLVGRGSTRDVKLLDFGTSKVLTGESHPTEPASMSSTGGWIGTPRYMAPEQLKLGHAITERTDIWAVGVVLHYLVAGAYPFTGETLEHYCRAALESEPLRLDAVRPETPRALADAVVRCLAKDPIDRFSSVAELAVVLQKFADGDNDKLVEGITAGGRRSRPLGSTARGPRAAAPRSWLESSSPRRRLPWPLTSFASGARRRPWRRTRAPSSLETWLARSRLHPWSPPRRPFRRPDPPPTIGSSNLPASTSRAAAPAVPRHPARAAPARHSDFGPRQ